MIKILYKYIHDNTTDYCESYTIEEGLSKTNDVTFNEVTVNKIIAIINSIIIIHIKCLKKISIIMDCYDKKPGSVVLNLPISP